MGQVGERGEEVWRQGFSTMQVKGVDTGGETSPMCLSALCKATYSAPWVGVQYTRAL